MEPAEKSILKQRPRPKNEPVVVPWMWCNMVLNGAILSVVIIAVYILSLVNFCDGEILQSNIDGLEGYEHKLMNAQTVAFVSLVFSENVSSYTSRSFDQPIWRNFLGNPDMHKAIILAQLALYAAVFMPFFSEEILGLRGLHIGLWGWGVALIGPLATLILCELAKVITHVQMRAHQRGSARTQKLEAEKQGKSDVAIELGKPDRSFDGIVRKVSGDVEQVMRTISGNSLSDYNKVKECPKDGTFVAL